MLLASKEYIKRGWVIHPLSKPNDTGNSPGKKPLLLNWSELKNTPEDIGSYIKKGYNIGLVCGKASGVDGMDIDLDLFTDELFEGVELHTLTSRHRPGRGHILFQHEDDMLAEKHHFIGLEYFGDSEKGTGSNLVLPPSKHYSGELYQWDDAGAPLAKIPDRFKQNWRQLAQKENALHDYFKKCRRCFTIGSKKYNNNDNDVRSKGLWDRPDDIAVHGMDGRRAVLAIMGELKTAGCPDDLMRMACKRFFGKDYDEETTREALKHIEAIPPKCDTLRQYLNVECDGCMWRPKTEKNNNISTHDSKDDPAPLQPKTKEMALKDIISLNKEEHERKLELSLPEDHFITRCVKWLNSINDGYQEYKIISSFWILSALAHNKIVLKLKQGAVRPNLWLCVLGRSTTSRKSTVVNACRGVYEVATDNILYNDDYSIEGYLETLSLNPVLHNVRDEVAGLMAKFHKKYNEGIFELECAVYDCQNIKKTLAGGKSKQPKTYVVNEPYVTKLYATTPDNFARYMTVDDFTCGYGYRFLFSHPKYNRDKMPLEMETEEDITAWATVLADIKKINRYFSETTETSYKVDPDAMKYYNSVLKELETRADESNNDFLGAAIGRNQGHILKLALLIEIGGKVNAQTISYNSMVSACNMVTQYFLPEMLNVIDRLQDDVKIYQVEKVSTTLRRKGGIMTHSQLLHDTKLKSKEFAECVSTLIESKTIEPIKEEKSKIVYYRMLNHNNSSILPIPKIPPLLLFSRADKVQENLENLNKLKKLDDTRTRALYTGAELGLSRESENEGNSGNSENRQSTSGERSQNSLNILGGEENLESSNKLIQSPEQPICPCGHPESYHCEDGCLGDGGMCECKHEIEKIIENTCYFCGTELQGSQPKINFGAGIGEVHETCMTRQEKAVRLLKARYIDYPPCAPEKAVRRIEEMAGYLSEQIENISGEGIKMAISVFCKERGWNIGGI